MSCHMTNINCNDFVRLPFSYAEQTEKNYQECFSEHLLAAVFTPTASFIWKSGNKLADILLRKRKREIESMRQGNDALSWTSDALSINPCVLTGGSNNTRDCAESQQPAAKTSPYFVTQRDGSIG